MKEASKAVVRIQKRKKFEAVEKFGGKCVLCGYSKCIAALEFHHLENKKEAPSYVIHSWSWERAKVELEKCILVCSNCHREIHSSEHDNQNKLEFKTKILPWIVLKCKNCSNKFESKNNEAMFCSVSCRAFRTRKTVRPSKEELQSLVLNKSILSISKLFGVSDNTIRIWVKAYNIAKP